MEAYYFDQYGLDKGLDFDQQFLFYSDVNSSNLQSICPIPSIWLLKVLKVSRFSFPVITLAVISVTARWSAWIGLHTKGLSQIQLFC